MTTLRSPEGSDQIFINQLVSFSFSYTQLINQPETSCRLSVGRWSLCLCCWYCCGWVRGGDLLVSTSCLWGQGRLAALITKRLLHRHSFPLVQDAGAEERKGDRVTCLPSGFLGAKAAWCPACTWSRKSPRNRVSDSPAGHFSDLLFLATQVWTELLISTFSVVITW